MADVGGEAGDGTIEMVARGAIADRIDRCQQRCGSLSTATAGRGWGHGVARLQMCGAA